MRLSAFITAATFLLVAAFFSAPLYSFARSQYESDDAYGYWTSQEIAALDAAQQQLDAQNAALEARRQQLEQRRIAQQQLAAQLTAIEQQLEAQRKALDAKTQELTQRKADQERTLEQLAAREQAMDARALNDGVSPHVVKDDNYNGIDDALEQLAHIALR